jgi:hypothetical protein
MAVISAPHAFPMDIANARICSLYQDLSIGASIFFTGLSMRQMARISVTKYNNHNRSYIIITTFTILSLMSIQPAFLEFTERDLA